ncbi:MAG: hypothetical protein JNK72_23585 [Myxococcales bacterium]|nr:hypothetical protein [Myxococcales bacterium]
MSELAGLLQSADNKFAAYLKEHKIDPIRVVYASTQIEKLTPTDRKALLAKRQTRGKEGDEAKAARSVEVRSGRPVTAQLLTRVLKGEKVAGPQKSRLVRAMNRIAEQKKLSAIDLSNLF